MTRLVFIHGINAEGMSATKIQTLWLNALNVGLQRADLDPLDISEIDCAYYGDFLKNESDSWFSGARADGFAARSFSNKSEYSNHQAALIGEMQRKLNISNEDILNRPENAQLERGHGAHKGWLKAVALAIEERIPAASRHIARIFLSQASAYLEKPKLKQAVDGMVREQVFPTQKLKTPTVVITHSLGTIVGYSILRELCNSVEVPLFITLGSPLGADLAKQKLPQPPMIPCGVKTWLNGADKDDFVALHTELTQQNFGVAGIDNVTAFNTSFEDKHSIVSYLGHANLAKRIDAALSYEPS